MSQKSLYPQFFCLPKGATKLEDTIVVCDKICRQQYRSVFEPRSNKARALLVDFRQNFIEDIVVIIISWDHFIVDFFKGIRRSYRVCNFSFLLWHFKGLRESTHAPNLYVEYFSVSILLSTLTVAGYANEVTSFELIQLHLY
jgi:hypothetical protein